MRALLALLVLPGLAPGVRGLVLAQAVPRTDTPRPGAVRVTFDPHIETWDAEFVQGRRLPLGATFTGDSARVWFPSVARLERDVRAVTGLAGYATTLGRYLLAIRAQRRITPIALEYGITSRLSLGATVPLVRVEVREQFRLRPPGSNLGPLPRLAADSARYRGFFGNLDAALASLGDSIAAGAYGCPTAPSCQRAGALQAEGRALRDALFRAVYGTADTVALYLPLLDSDAGRKIATIITGLERALADTFRIAQFSRDTFLLPATPVPGAAADSVLAARLSALGLAPYGRATPERLRYFLGDVEVAAKYRFFVRRNLATAATLVIRLPTGHQDSPNDPFDVATGDHQTDVEGHVTQELVLGNRLWLNLSIRGGRQLAGERERRVGGGRRASCSCLRRPSPGCAGIPATTWQPISPPYTGSTRISPRD